MFLHQILINYLRIFDQKNFTKINNIGYINIASNPACTPCIGRQRLSFDNNTWSKKLGIVKSKYIPQPPIPLSKQ